MQTINKTFDFLQVQMLQLKPLTCPRQRPRLPHRSSQLMFQSKKGAFYWWKPWRLLKTFSWIPPIYKIVLTRQILLPKSSVAQVKSLLRILRLLLIRILKKFPFYSKPSKRLIIWRQYIRKFKVIIFRGRTVKTKLKFQETWWGTMN